MKCKYLVDNLLVPPQCFTSKMTKGGCVQYVQSETETSYFLINNLYFCIGNCKEIISMCEH